MNRLSLAIAAVLSSFAVSAADSGGFSPTTEASPVVLRLSNDGDWVGVVRVDPARPGEPELLIAPVHPAQRLGAPLTIGGLFSVPVAEAGRLYVGSEQQWSPNQPGSALPAAWCQGMMGLIAGASECVSAIGTAQPLMPAVQRRSTTAGWSGNQFELALSYGSTANPQIPGYALPANSPALLLSPLPSVFAPLAATSEMRDLTVSGLWRLAPWGGITWSAGVSESVLAGTSPLALDQAALQVGLTRGAFSGGITGRVVRPGAGFDPNASYWTGLDIGISWRTPWRAEISVGAQNLIGRSSSALPSPEVPAIDEATARTPYVRYTQDL
jgi:hypothetical protein